MKRWVHIDDETQRAYPIEAIKSLHADVAAARSSLRYTRWCLGTVVVVNAICTVVAVSRYEKTIEAKTSLAEYLRERNERLSERVKIADSNVSRLEDAYQHLLRQSGESGAEACDGSQQAKRSDLF